MVKVVIERKVKKENYAKLLEYLKDMRRIAISQPGYITGETLIRGTNPVHVLVISTWISEDYWKAWTTNETRIEIANLAEQLLEEEPESKVYKPVA